MRFSECPNCGNNEGGYKIFRCKKCNEMYCWRDEGFFGGSSGCSTGSECPCCGESLDVGVFSDSFEEVGEIEED